MPLLRHDGGVQAWLLAAGTIAGIAAEGLIFGYLADLVLKRWHPERPGDPFE